MSHDLMVTLGRFLCLILEPEQFVSCVDVIVPTAEFEEIRLIKIGPQLLFFSSLYLSVIDFLERGSIIHQQMFFLR